MLRKKPGFAATNWWRFSLTWPDRACFSGRRTPSSRFISTGQFPGSH